ncbi:hypothetical protein HCN51_06935 [Nonomuraea sp. FMUSA5-5]|uniref:Uncharacterized protein n=1 Tax=Nonomuraea composti TaxID=2720023 RepID=A0ABX1AU83_9ACTN|nr:hypothetical protein [Nonomuraea sp. FMUSA5-5]NJP89183.1 hypothetical protein [Nonomuraea sp. FMUSA5-5]
MADREKAREGRRKLDGCAGSDVREAAMTEVQAKRLDPGTIDAEVAGRAMLFILAQAARGRGATVIPSNAELTTRSRPPLTSSRH